LRQEKGRNSKKEKSNIVKTPKRLFNAISKRKADIGVLTGFNNSSFSFRGNNSLNGYSLHIGNLNSPTIGIYYTAPTYFKYYKTNFFFNTSLSTVTYRIIEDFKYENESYQIQYKALSLNLANSFRYTFSFKNFSLSPDIGFRFMSFFP